MVCELLGPRIQQQSLCSKLGCGLRRRGGGERGQLKRGRHEKKGGEGTTCMVRSFSPFEECVDWMFTVYLRRSCDRELSSVEL